MVLRTSRAVLLVGIAAVLVLAPVDGWAAVVVKKHSVKASAAKFGPDWPLTVPSGILSCRGSAVFFKTQGVRYGVNGTALSGGAPRIDPIWKDDPATGFKKNIGPLIDRGLRLC